MALSDYDSEVRVEFPGLLREGDHGTFTMVAPALGEAEARCVRDRLRSGDFLVTAIKRKEQVIA